MPPPGLQVYLHPRVTLSFDLLTPRVDRFVLLPRGPCTCVSGINIGSCFQNIKHRVYNYKFGNMQTNERTNGLTD